MAHLNPLSKSPIEHKSQLIEYLGAGCKSASTWKIGVEYERFLYRSEDLNPIFYHDSTKAPSIRKLFEVLTQVGWQPYYEGQNIIALSKNGSTITLEPGGQFELASSPQPTLHHLDLEMSQNQQEIKQIGINLGIGMLYLGFQPKYSLEEIPVMPKGRYEIMKEYMPTKGKLGLDMMFRTATLQVCLDFGSEMDMVKKIRTSIALQPIMTAIFANSPFKENYPNGYLSYRSHIWTDTDPDRCGMLPFMFEEGAGFERYVDYALDVPMYFVYRNNCYTKVFGQTFRDFLNGQLKAFPREKPILDDWINHLTTIFPEVRLKHYLEMRGVDCGPWELYSALPALWVGLLYHNESLDAVWDIVKNWTESERQMLRINVPKLGLNTKVGKFTVRDIAFEVLKIADNGLKQRNKLNSKRENESIFLDPLWTLLEKGMSPAEELLKLYNGQWKKSLESLYDVAKCKEEADLAFFPG